MRWKHRSRCSSIAIVRVAAGTLDDDPDIRPQQNIFWTSRGVWCVESSELPKYDELPPRKK
jgi:hypothetical protein